MRTRFVGASIEGEQPSQAVNAGQGRGHDDAAAARDAMEFINEQDPATIERFVARLELRGKDPTFVAYGKTTSTR